MASHGDIESEALVLSKRPASIDVEPARLADTLRNRQTMEVENRPRALVRTLNVSKTSVKISLNLGWYILVIKISMYCFILFLCMLTYTI